MRAAALASWLLASQVCALNLDRLFQTKPKAKVRSEFEELLDAVCTRALIALGVTHNALGVTQPELKPWRARKVKYLKFHYHPWKESWKERFRDPTTEDTVHLYGIPRYRFKPDRTAVTGSRSALVVP